MKIISVRENREYTEKAILYIQKKWGNETLNILYRDCIEYTKGKGDLPQWYLLMKAEKIIGCAGLVTNDFISRMDLYPWICALYIDEEYRGKAYSRLLLEKAEKDALSAGFKNIYLCTDHIGFYEKNGYSYIATGYHPWGETSRIYNKKLL